MLLLLPTRREELRSKRAVLDLLVYLLFSILGFSFFFSVSSLLIVSCFLFFYFIMKSANIIWWNYRGISTRDTSSRILCFIQSHKSMLMCLVETMANSDRINHFCSNLLRNWKWVAILADSYFGGIIILLNKLLSQLTPMVVSRRAMLVIISPVFFFENHYYFYYL